MTEFVPVINTITSITAIVIAVLSIYINGKRNRFTLGTDIFLKQSDRFSTKEFINKRKKLAQKMKSINSRKEIGVNTIEKCPQKDEILDFFQIIGLMAKRKVINLDLLHSRFAFWLSHYWIFFKEEIEQKRIHDKGVWKDAEWLKEKFEKLNSKTNRNISNKTMNQFIDYELNLLDESSN